MNVTEGNAVSHLLGWVCGIPGPVGRITDEQAKEAAEYLAGRSYKALMAGVRPEQIRANWPDTSPATTNQNGNQ